MMLTKYSNISEVFIGKTLVFPTSETGADATLTIWKDHMAGIFLSGFGPRYFLL